MQEFERFEVEFANWIGHPAQSMVACASGSAALHLALEALRLPSGSEVICPDYTMVACPRAIVMAGLVPVFVDCGDDLLMDVLLPEYITHPGLRAVLAVHIYGRRCNMGRLLDLTSIKGQRALYVIEDMAELHGIQPHKDTDAACWSFYRNKCVAGEEGGAVAFLAPRHAYLARQLRSLGFTDAHDYNHVPRGHNYRMSNAHAQLIRRSLAEVEGNIRQRRMIEGWYYRHCPDEWRMPARDAVWVYDLRIKGMDKSTQDHVVATLKANGIAARHGFRPMSQQEEFRSCRVIGNGNAARLASSILYLPVQPGITTEEQAKSSFDLIRKSL